MWCSLAWVTGSWRRWTDTDVIGFTTAIAWDGLCYNHQCILWMVSIITKWNASYSFCMILIPTQLTLLCWFLTVKCVGKIGQCYPQVGKCQPAQEEHVHWAWDVHLLDFQGDSCFHWSIYGVSCNDVQQLILKSMNERSLQMEWCQFFMTIWPSHVHHT